MRVKGVSFLVRTITESYVNEVCLDRALKDKFLGGEPGAAALPQYKIMPLFALWKRYGKKFLLMLFVLRLVLPLALAVGALANVILALGRVFLRPKSTAELPELICLPSSGNFKLFHYLFDDFEQRERFRCKAPWRMLSYLSVSDHLRATVIVWGVLLKVLTYGEQQGVRRRDLVFHLLDLIQLTWFTLFVEKAGSAGKALVTDCNLQRWDFIATKLADRCSIIQHAYIHSDIDFFYPFGAVDCLYLFDSAFEAVFARYYHFNTSAIIRPKIDLQPLVEGKKVLFLASSAPYIQFEIDFLRKVKENLEFFVALKLHPRHVYESSVERLVELADTVLDAGCFPDCEYMVSYDSFLGFEYKALGKRVLFLKDEDSVNAFMEASSK